MTSRRWMGHAWIAAAALALALTPMAPSSAATVSESNLAGVDCVGPHACLAVGDALARQVVPLAERFNGSAWSVVPVGKLGAGAKLAGVSCPTAAWCAVVGGNNDGSLVAQYSGGSVAKFAQPPLTPLGTHLTAVACRSTTWCVAVGETHASALIVQLRGTKWTVASTPSISSGEVTLTSVSCPTTTSCMAVGYAAKAYAAPTAVALWLHAGKWQKLTMAFADKASEPDAVSCPTTAWCEAVGGSNGVAGPAVSQFTGGKWVKASAPTGQAGALVSVDCVATQFCVTVGNNGGGGRFATIQASGAVPASAAALHSPDAFSQLSCWARAGCVAVGHDSSRSYLVGAPLADLWIGGAWVASELPSLTY